MKTLSRFIVKYSSLIIAALSCFDRVIFKGYLPITNGSALEQFVDHVLKMRRADFMGFAAKQADTLVEHAQQLAQQAGAEYRFLQGADRKDKLVDDILRKRPISEGLICVFCCMELPFRVFREADNANVLPVYATSRQDGELRKTG